MATIREHDSIRSWPEVEEAARDTAVSDGISPDSYDVWNYAESLQENEMLADDFPTDSSRQYLHTPRLSKMREILGRKIVFVHLVLARLVVLRLMFHATRIGDRAWPVAFDTGSESLNTNRFPHSGDHHHVARDLNLWPVRIVVLIVILSLPPG